jgi:hypothetical protein
MRSGYVAPCFYVLLGIIYLLRTDHADGSAIMDITAADI